MQVLEELIKLAKAMDAAGANDEWRVGTSSRLGCGFRTSAFARASNTGEEILQELQADFLAFLRMKLGGEDVFLPDRRGKRIPVPGPRGDDRRVLRLGKEAMHKA